jgi:hypothetical protein
MLQRLTLTSRRGAVLPGLLLPLFLVPLLWDGTTSRAFDAGADNGPELGASEPSFPLVLPTGPSRAPRGGVAAHLPRPAPYPVSVDGRSLPFEVQAMAVLPGQELTLEGRPELYLLETSGPVPPSSPGRWVWTAPSEPGAVALRIQGADGWVDLNVLVMRPMSEVRNGTLNGYRIGRYVGDPHAPNPLHRPPVGFVEVNPEDEDLLVTPHFTLGQFLCKDPGDPRYVVLSEPLLVKLEAVLEAVNEAGIRAPTLHIMSGFRTPAYNRAIGNTTDLSRHLWGDAADIFVDTNGNGMMDDLNGDGRVNDEDGRLLMRIVESVDRGGASHIQPGGLSLYKTIPGRGPFVHVDARGHHARW